MAYVPDLGSAVSLGLLSPYTPDAGDEVALHLGEVVTGDTAIIAGTFDSMTCHLNGASIIDDADVAGQFRGMYAEIILPIDWLDINGEFGTTWATVTVDQPFTAVVAGQFDDLYSGIDATSTEFTAQIAGRFWPLSGSVYEAEIIRGTMAQMSALMETSIEYGAIVAGEFGQMSAQTTVGMPSVAVVSGVFGDLFGRLSASGLAISITAPGVLAFTRDSTPTGLPVSVPTLPDAYSFSRDAFVAPTDTDVEIEAEILSFER